MHVSINPLYRCNFRCPDCYLTNEQLSSKQLLDLDVLRERLAQIPHIDAVELYGGEITLVPYEYFTKLKRVVREFYGGSISVVTNLFLVPEWLYDEDLTINVSFDFEYRPHYETVLNNILGFERASLDLIILATPDVMAGDVNAQIQMVKMFRNVRSVDIKPYSANQANCHTHTNRQYVEYIKTWIENYDNERLKPVRLLDDVISGRRNAFSDDHVYITPTGAFGVLEFDLLDREYFLELPDYEAYLEWCRREKNVLLSDVCQGCDYKGRCLTEHYRRDEGKEDECSGFKSLIEWWVEETA